MARRKPEPYMTYADYLALEESSDVRWEWLDGVVWAMAGGTPLHAELGTNITILLGIALRGRPCRPYNSDLRIRVPETGLAFHPDVSVVCGPLEPHAEDPNAATNPTVLVEVLSKSTEAYDRFDKLHHYRQLPSLRDYVLVSQGHAHVEHYHRNEDGSWTLHDLGPGESVALLSIGATLVVDEIYAGVVFPPKPPPQAAEA